MKYILILSMFLVGCGDDSHNKEIVVDCERNQVLQFEHNIGDTYFIKVLPLTVDSNCQVKIQTEGK